MWSDDAELQSLFRDEVSERAQRLAAGARALGAGKPDADQLTALARDAHTIKGSSRVMGFSSMARGAELLEEAWRRVQGGTLEPTAELAQAAARLADALGEAVAAHPAEGTAVLANALAEMSIILGTEHRPSTPELPAANQGPQSFDTSPLQPTHPVDLGGLLSALRADVVEESASVESGGLYRLISRAAEARVDSGHLRETVSALRMAAASSPREVAALAARWEEAVEVLEETIRDLQEQAMALAAVPLSEITGAFPRLTRYLARRTGKHVSLERIGDDVEVDRQILDQMSEPLRHLVVNAIEHGIETPGDRQASGKPPTGHLSLRARLEEGKLVVVVEDDGRGVDWAAVAKAARAHGFLEGEGEGDLSQVLFRPGFTTARKRSEFGGDGSGLAILGEVVETLNGSVQVDSAPGRGTRVEVRVPAWWALKEALLVRAGDHTFGIPKSVTADTFPLSAARVEAHEGRRLLSWRQELLEVVSLAEAVGLPADELAGEVVVLTTRAGSAAFTVGEILGSRQVVVKALGPLIGEVPHLSGAAVLGGEAVVVVEPNRLIERLQSSVESAPSKPRLLVVDDSPGVRQLLGATLAAHGFLTVAAGSASQALELLDREDVDGLVVDYSMPESDGVQLVEDVRRAHRQIPIVMVSAVADEDVQERARQAGVNAYFDKSDLRYGALVSTLRNLIEARARGRVRAES